jgi:hypothetical protein
MKLILHICERDTFKLDIKIKNFNRLKHERLNNYNLSRWASVAISELPDC